MPAAFTRKADPCSGSSQQILAHISWVASAVMWLERVCDFSASVVGVDRRTGSGWVGDISACCPATR